MNIIVKKRKAIEFIIEDNAEYPKISTQEALRPSVFEIISKRPKQTLPQTQENIERPQRQRTKSSKYCSQSLPPAPYFERTTMMQLNRVVKLG